NARGGIVVERSQRIAIDRAALGLLGGERIVERQLGDAVAQMRRRDRAGAADAASLGEMGDHIGSADRADGLERQQFRIARADADAQKLPRSVWLAGVHNPGLASALIAAAVMALPPLRPRTVKNGTPRGFSASAAFDSAAPTKPTGTPRIAAGFGAPSSIMSSRRNRAVGALPMATSAPARRSRHNSSAAAERVVPSFAASESTRASLSVQITALFAGSLARVTPRATISLSHRIGAPAASAPRATATRLPPNRMCCAISTCPQAWIMRTTISASSAEKGERSASARMMANDRS